MRRYPTLLALAVTVAGVLTGPGTAQAAPVTPSANDWIEVQHPRPGGADTYLNDVVVPAANDVWAVGYTFDVVGGAFEFRTYGQHCVSGVCTRANLPSREGAPATNILYGIGAVSANELWTVGYSRDPREPGIGLTIHYTNGTWRIVDSPNPPGAFSSSLKAVSANSSTNALAVGSYQDGSTLEERPLALGWDGATWRLITVPTAPGCTDRGRLTDVTKLGGRYYVTGICRTTGGTEESYVLEVANRSWTTLLRPGDGTLEPGDALASITVVPTAMLWAVGSNPATGTGVSLALRGSSWTNIPVPQAGQYTQLTGVAGTSRVDVWSVGATSQGAGPQRLSLRWTGQPRTWSIVPAGEATSLAAVAFDPAGYYWAVGHNNRVSVIQRRAW
ncbi:MAG: hypothetical protein M3513_11690 [Actinomycetota bacterium]|nr:hypothetical protein [Actinomycetota bacterium]